MSPRTGRPTNDPKSLNTRIRLSKTDIERLDYCVKALGMTKSEIVRQGISEMYEKAKRKE